MKKTVSKIFLLLSGILVVLTIILSLINTFYSDYYFKIKHDFANPNSEFIENKKSDTSILLLSDSGSNNLILKKVLQQALTSQKYDFIMYLGDFVQTGSVTEFYWMLNDIKPVLKETPFYTIPGNHDIKRKIGKIKIKDKSFYETIMESRYYWFGYGDTLFITLDSSDETLDKKQLEWLDTTLKKIRPMFQNCIILSHVPPVNSKINHIMTFETAKKFKQIIKNYKINAMFFGHVHFFSHEIFANIPCYTSPSSGQSARFQTYGYLNVDINKNGIIKVEPKYVEVTGKRREFIKEWFISEILSVKCRVIILSLLRLSLISLIIALIARKYHK